MKPIEKNAGYNIVEFERFNPYVPYFIVLGHNPKTNMWVTWECRAPDDFYGGCYIANEWLAKMDYHKRLMDAYIHRYRLELPKE